MSEKIVEKFDEVKRLEETTDKETQIDFLQKIAARLLNECVIKVGSVTIEPLLVEAYYFNSKTGFVDENTHGSEKQKNNFGKLYFHEKGRGGVDICLSDGDYCLSYLIKNALVTTPTAERKFCRQTYVKDALVANGLKGTTEYALYERAHKENRIVFYNVRKGLTKCNCYQNMPIAAVTGFELKNKENKRYVFDLEKKDKEAKESAKEILVIEYIKKHPNAFTETQFKDHFMGYVPKAIHEAGWLKK